MLFWVCMGCNRKHMFTWVIKLLENLIMKIHCLNMCLIYIASVVRTCKDEYYGLNCRLRCPFPYFGESCVLACNCSKKLCHHARACKTAQGTCNVRFTKYILSHIKKVKYCYWWREYKCNHSDILQISPLWMQIFNTTQVLLEKGGDISRKDISASSSSSSVTFQTRAKDTCIVTS